MHYQTTNKGKIETIKAGTKSKIILCIRTFSRTCAEDVVIKHLSTPVSLKCIAFIAQVYHKNMTCIVVRNGSVGIATDNSLTVRGSNLGEEEILASLPDRAWVPPSLLYSGYRVSFPGVKRPGRGHLYLSP